MKGVGLNVKDVANNYNFVKLFEALEEVRGVYMRRKSVEQEYTVDEAGIDGVLRNISQIESGGLYFGGPRKVLDLTEQARADMLPGVEECWKHVISFGVTRREGRNIMRADLICPLNEANFELTTMIYEMSYGESVPNWAEKRILAYEDVRPS
ncbi:MAG: hypothetical protein ACE5FT_06215 [Candidatus Nanoarchaeia archaeon]